MASVKHITNGEQIGGSLGHASIAVASKYPNLHFQVQDLITQEEPAKALIKSKGLDSRIDFRVTDFFEPQPSSAHGAAVYFMRWILHDWSDQYARKILTNIVAVMAPHSKIVIADAVLPPAGVLSNGQEMMLRAFDVSMFIQLNSRERAPEDWHALFISVDPRLRITSVKPPQPGVSYTLVEVELVENKDETA
jgi:6-hydroxytryprostatin B O-methyltransferase